MRRFLMISIGITLFIAFLLNINFRGAIFHIRSINFLWVIFIVIFNALIPLFKSIRWQKIINKVDIEHKMTEIFKAISAGFFLGIVTPATSGELGRVFTIKIKKSTGAVTIVYEKILDFATLFFLSANAVLILVLGGKVFITMSILLWVSFLGFIFILLRYNELLKRIGSFFTNRFLSRKVNPLGKMHDVLVYLLNDRGLMFYSTSISLILWAIPAIQFYIICNLLGISTSLHLVLISFFLPYLAGIFSFIPLGLGIREFSTIGILISVFNVSPAVAGAVVILVRITCTLPLLIWGFACYVYQVRRMK